MKLPTSVIRKVTPRIEAVVQDAVWEYAEDIRLSEDEGLEWADQIVVAMIEAAEGVDAPKGDTE